MGPCSTTLRLAPAILIASLSGLASDGHDDNAPDGFGHVITFKPDCLQSHYQVRALTRKPDGTICREIGPIDLTIHRAKPASVAFGGASETADNAAAIKQRIASLPDETRWLVAVASRGSAQGQRFYTEQEVRELVLSLDAATKQAILNETAPVLSDVAERAGAHETFYHNQAKAILERKPLPEPTIPPEFERFRRNLNPD